MGSITSTSSRMRSADSASAIELEEGAGDRDPKIIVAHLLGSGES
jgi:hypothetical protein